MTFNYSSDCYSRSSNRTPERKVTFTLAFVSVRSVDKATVETSIKQAVMNVAIGKSLIVLITISLRTRTSARALEPWKIYEAVNEYRVEGDNSYDRLYK